VPGRAGRTLKGIESPYKQLKGFSFHRGDGTVIRLLSEPHTRFLHIRFESRIQKGDNETGRGGTQKLSWLASRGVRKRKYSAGGLSRLKGVGGEKKKFENRTWTSLQHRTSRRPRTHRQRVLQVPKGNILGCQKGGLHALERKKEKEVTLARVRDVLHLGGGTSAETWDLEDFWGIGPRKV